MTTQVTSPLKVSSYLCLACGPLTGLGVFLGYVDGFCFFVWYLNNTAGSLQFVFLGIYQISRLHYCFSRERVYSNKGYSRCVFVAMLGVSAVLALNVLALPFLMWGVPSRCGINSRLEFEHEFWKEPWVMKADGAAIVNTWVTSLFAAWALWDLTTLLLYVCKIRSFRKFKSDNAEVYARIQAILRRVVIVTVFYELSVLFLVLIGLLAWNMLGHDIIYLSVLSAGSVIVSFAQYIMLEHNTAEYDRFLNVLRSLRLHYLCCCCVDIGTGTSEERNAVPSLDKHAQANATWDTREMTQMAHEQRTGMELSLETFATVQK